LIEDRAKGKGKWQELAGLSFQESNGEKKELFLKELHKDREFLVMSKDGEYG